MYYGNEDWAFLLSAYAAGGVCVVRHVAARASLIRAGLMEPAPNITVGFGYRHPKAMRLTKAGQKRAASIWAQQLGRNSRDHKNLRKDKNRLVNHNRSERRYAAMVWVKIWL